MSFLIIAILFKIFPAWCRIGRLIFVLTRPTSVQSNASRPISLMFLLIVSAYLHLILQSVSSSQVPFPNYSHLFHECYTFPPILWISIFIHCTRNTGIQFREVSEKYYFMFFFVQYAILTVMLLPKLNRVKTPPQKGTLHTVDTPLITFM